MIPETKTISATYVIKVQDSDDWSAVQKVTIEVPKKTVMPKTRELLIKAIKKNHAPQVELSDDHINIIMD